MWRPRRNRFAGLFLRLLPCSVNLALQRRLWPGSVFLDGMSDACRQRVMMDFLYPDGRPQGESGKTDIRCPTYGPPFDPPWTVFPTYPGLASMGFRMGGGQDYMVQFQKWYDSASDSEVAEYKTRHPAPENYTDFYETLDGWHRRSTKAPLG